MTYVSCKDNAKPLVCLENNVEQEKPAKLAFVPLAAQEMTTAPVKTYATEEIVAILVQ